MNKKQAPVGGTTGINGYFYKGGQFLPSTQAEPGKWKIGKKWVRSSMEKTGPNEWSHQPTPFSRSLFVLAGVGYLTRLRDGKLEVNADARDYAGRPVTGDMEIRPGVKGVHNTESLKLQEIVDAWNAGQRWFDVQPNVETVVTNSADINEFSTANALPQSGFRLRM